MVAYPNNINVSIASHGPCGLKVDCDKCQDDASPNHDESEIINIIKKELNL